MFMFTHDDDYL